MSKEELSKAIDNLPLDKWQLEAATKGIECLTEEEAQEIVNELNAAFSLLLGILHDLSSALGSAEIDLLGATLQETDLTEAIVENAQFTGSKGISESRKRDLISRGAIFDDPPNKPSAVPDRVPSPRGR